MGLGFLIPHTKAGTNGRYLAGLLIRNGLVKSVGLATPSFFPPSLLCDGMDVLQTEKSKVK